MAPEASKFESSEMLATNLASTPLLEESWRLCRHANAAAHRSFAVNVVGQVAYVAFSGLQVVDFSEGKCRDLVELEKCSKEIFDLFRFRVEGGEPVRVHGGLLQLFLCFYETQSFQQKILEISNQSKSVIFTGHSLGGAVASLAALWLLSYIQKTSLTTTVLCITYGSPLLGNNSFSQAILQERWVGNFCHVVARHDLVPRLLLAPATPFISQVFRVIVELWHSSITSSYLVQMPFQLPDGNKAELFENVLSCTEARLQQDENQEIISPYWPFGSYMFCTDKGAICLDNSTAIVKFLHLIMVEGCPNSCIEDHLKYEDCVRKVYLQYLVKRSFMEVNFSESSNEAGLALALQSSGISSQEPVYGIAMNCLATARQLGWRRTLNNAKMAVSLARINPLRAELECYKAYCDNSNDQLGYYDSFKRRGASRRGFRVNMDRIRLGRFWDNIIDKLEKNELTHDFHKMSKYVNGSRFYRLLVEPLEIAEYYRTGMHRHKGHYIEHGREKRFKIFDKWWGDRKRNGKVGDEESKPRSKYASFTQDSCFWARVEEARDCILHVLGETDLGKRLAFLDKIEKFEHYATGMIERKMVSKDVLAKYSSYNLFTEEWRDLKSQLQLRPSHFPGFQDGMVQ